MRNEPEHHFVDANGVTLSVYEWEGDGLPILFLHAAGFHARCWDQVIYHLDGHHCYAVDLRGHGQSEKLPVPYHWRDLAEDVAAACVALDLQDIVAIGHSVGGHTAALTAYHLPDRISQLILLDPVILPRSQYTGPQPGEHFTARRRNVWSSPDDMYRAFENRPPFNLWQPRVLRDYCTYGLLEAGDAYMLACPPEVEASIFKYATALDADIYDEISQVSAQTRILLTGEEQQSRAVDLGASPTAPNVASFFPNAMMNRLQYNTHFAPMEAPQIIAGHVHDLTASGV